jgi:hypothetical protein
VDDRRVRVAVLLRRLAVRFEEVRDDAALPRRVERAGARRLATPGAWLAVRVACFRVVVVVVVLFAAFLAVFLTVFFADFLAVFVPVLLAAFLTVFLAVLFAAFLAVFFTALLAVFFAAFLTGLVAVLVADFLAVFFTVLFAAFLAGRRVARPREVVDISGPPPLTPLR